MNHLVITADDFGLSNEVNEAVELAHRQGILSAASLMIGGPACADALRRARRLPGLRVGLHLVLVEGRPISRPRWIPGLMGGADALRTDLARLGCDIALYPSIRRQMLREIVAQFKAFAATCLPLDHVNAHKHFHLHPIVAGQVMTAGRYFGMRAMRIPSEPAAVLVRAEPNVQPGYAPTEPWARLLRSRAGRANLIVPHAVFGLRWSGTMTRDRIRALLKHLPPGLIEIYIHPAIADDFAGHASGYRYADELAALCADSNIEALRGSGYSVGGYADWEAGAGSGADHRARQDDDLFADANAARVHS